MSLSRSDFEVFFLGWSEGGEEKETDGRRGFGCLASRSSLSPKRASACRTAPRGRTMGMSSRKVATKNRAEGMAMIPVKNSIDAGARMLRQWNGR